MTAADEQPQNPYFSRTAHRILWAATWVLFLLGMLAWFIQGANRPVDPILTPALVLVVLCGFTFG